MIALTKHASIRAQQRDFSREVCLFVAREGDVQKPARDGRRAVFISQHKVDTLASQGFNTAFLKEALRCVVVIARNAIVTVHDGAQMSRSFN